MDAVTEIPSLESIRAAHAALAGVVTRTPLMRLPLEGAPAEIWLKLENLQPIGAFKLRGAANAMRSAEPAALARGVWTASAGTMAQGVAWEARRRGIPCAVLAPDHAPDAKLTAIRRLGGTIVKAPFRDWFEVLATRRWPGMNGHFIHPVSDPAVMAGNGTIGLEILEDLEDVDAVVIPWGGGGLACGIAAAFAALRPATRILACEVDTAAPLAAALAAGEPRPTSYTPSFVDGMGGPFVLPEMWPLAQRLIHGSRVVSLRAVAEAIRLLAGRCRVIAEGAGAAPLAAALAGGCGSGRVVCVVSGGNIDASVLAKILIGEIP
jgi:threonine dehydratase